MTVCIMRSCAHERVNQGAGWLAEVQRGSTNADCTCTCTCGTRSKEVFFWGGGEERGERAHVNPPFCYSRLVRGKRGGASEEGAKSKTEQGQDIGSGSLQSATALSRNEGRPRQGQGGR